MFGEARVRNSTWGVGNYICSAWLVLVTTSFLASASAQQVTPKAHELVDEKVHVAHALFTQRTSSPDLALLNQITLAVLDAGGTSQSAVAAIQEASLALEARRKALLALGAFGAPDTLAEAREALEVTLEVPSLRGSKAATALRRARLDWDASVSEGLIGGRLGVAALQRLQEKQTAAIAEVHKRYRASDVPVQEVFDQVLLPSLGVKPSASLQQLLIASRQFGEQPFVAAFVANAQKATLPDLRQVFEQEMKRVHGTTLDEIANLRKGTPQAVEDLVLDQLKDRTGLDAKRLESEARRLKNGLNLGNADAGVYLASSLIGAFDEKLGRDIHRVGQMAIQVSKIVQGLGDSQAVDGAAGAQMGLAVATGGSTAVLMLAAQMAMSSQAGPSTDELVLRQLQAIQEQIAALGARMDERFDRVDAALELIYNDMHLAFSLVDRELRSIQSTQVQLVETMLAQDRKLNMLAADMMDALDRLRDANADLLLAPCQRWKETTVTIDMTGADFVHCLSRLVVEAEKVLLSTSPDDATAARFQSSSLAAKLSTPPHRNLQFLAHLSSNEGLDLVPTALQKMLVDPGRWMAAAAVYEQLARDWPAHYFGTPLQQARGIAEHGTTMYLAARTLRSDEGVSWLLSIAKRYKALASEYSSILRANRTAIDDGNSAWWTPSVGDVTIPFCDHATDRDLGALGVRFRSWDWHGTSSSVRAARVPSLFPAFIDELERSGLGKTHRCVSGQPKSLTPTGLFLMLVSWFEVPAIYDQSKLTELKAKHGTDWYSLSDAEIEPLRRYLIHDVQTFIPGSYPLPKQLCGIVCDPPLGPVVAAYIPAAWAADGKNAVERGDISWNEDSHGGDQKIRADQDRVSLIALSLTKVPTLQERHVSTGHAAGLAAPMPCGPVGDRACMSTLIGGAALALRQFLELGFADALERSDALRALVLGRDGLVTTEMLQNWAALGVDPLQVASVLEKRATAVVALLETEMKISVERTRHVHGPLQRSVLRLQQFLEDVAEACAMQKHHPDACR